MANLPSPEARVAKRADRLSPHCASRSRSQTADPSRPGTSAETSSICPGSRRSSVGSIERGRSSSPSMTSIFAALLAVQIHSMSRPERDQTLADHAADVGDEVGLRAHRVQVRRERPEVPLDAPGGRALRVEPEVPGPPAHRSEEHTSELQSQSNLVCRLLL